MIPMSDSPLVSVIIPNFSRADYLENCLRSLLRQDYPRMEIVVVDNASQDRSAEVVRALAPRAILLRQERNLGYAGAVNAGISVSSGAWIAVLNNDTEVAPEWLGECVNAVKRHPDAAFLACRILDFKDRARIYSAGDCFLRAGVGYRRGQEQQDCLEYHEECEIFSACGCAALYDKAVLEKAGGFDQRFFAYLEDVDLGLRLQAFGWRGYYAPRAEVYHHGSVTSGGEFSSLAVFLRTRNSLFLLLKSIPARIIWRSLPMILFLQISWILRVAAHGRLVGYIRGLGSALLMAPGMIVDRGRMRSAWRESHAKLWQQILRSEYLASRDFTRTSPGQVSSFLKWYFRVSATSEESPQGRAKNRAI